MIQKLKIKLHEYESEMADDDHLVLLLLVFLLKLVLRYDLIRQINVNDTYMM